MKHIALILLIALALPCSGIAAEQRQKGKKLAFERAKGNCLACHAIEDGEMPGNIGPPLINMQKRFKNRELLKQQIWDATVRNPQTSMPPFGRNNILTPEELDLVVEYIWSL